MTLPTVEPAERERLLSGILRDVSRAFYLTLRVLPDGVREPVGLAYLLARAADTVADTAILPASDRLRHLLAFREQVNGSPDPRALEEIRAALGEPATAGEGALMARLPSALSLLQAQDPADRESIRQVVDVLTQGMEMDLDRFPPESSGALRALETPTDLNVYTFLVAGCVGRFWTDVTARHTPALARTLRPPAGEAREGTLEALAADGVLLGHALQLTNILRDLPKDLRLGRCYLPAEELRAQGLAPEDLLEPSSLARARPVLHRWVEEALHRYQGGLRYVLALPRTCPRLRLAALWPLLIGLDTLALLVRSPRWLDPRQRVKISRKRVYALVALSLPAVLLDPVLRAWVGTLRRRVEEGMGGAG